MKILIIKKEIFEILDSICDFILKFRNLSESKNTYKISLYKKYFINKKHKDYIEKGLYILVRALSILKLELNKKIKIKKTNDIIDHFLENKLFLNFNFRTMCEIQETTSIINIQSITKHIVMKSNVLYQNLIHIVSMIYIQYKIIEYYQEVLTKSFEYSHKYIYSIKSISISNVSSSKWI